MVEKKQKETKREKVQTDELKELLQRTQANFENYRKQTEKRVTEIRKLAAKDTILQLLPILDNFELALKNSKDEKAFKEGIVLIHAQLNKMLENSEVKVIKTEGERFDPYLHEALMKVESDKTEDEIVEEFQKGFTMSGEVIRHAKVKISSGEIKENKIDDKMEVQETENVSGNPHKNLEE
jgi:molecular chaperone GrpE